MPERKINRSRKDISDTTVSNSFLSQGFFSLSLASTASSWFWPLCMCSLLLNTLKWVLGCVPIHIPLSEITQFIKQTEKDVIFVRCFFFWTCSQIQTWSPYSYIWYFWLFYSVKVSNISKEKFTYALKFL